MEIPKRSATTAERLQEAMRLTGKKQADLVHATKLNKSTISRYISGEVEPRQEAAIKLAKALDVSEMWLWGYDVPMRKTEGQKKNDALVQVVAKLRADPDFLDVVSLLAELQPAEYASMKQILTALVNK